MSGAEEAAEVAALAAKQAAEAEEREQLRKSKLQWSEHLKEASDRAKQHNVEGAELEDYLIKETIGKNLVPAQHLTECVGMILQSRHSAETSKLMESNFDKRIGAMKAATDAVLQEKNLERVDLVERLHSEGKTEEDMEKAMVDFEERYAHKQAEAEKNAVTFLEEDAIGLVF